MKKVILKSFVGALVFGFTLVGVFYMVSARSGLTANSGDKLTSSKWNVLSNSTADAWSVKSNGYVQGTTPRQQIPGLSTTINLDRPALVQLFANGSLRTINSNLCHVWVRITINGVDKAKMVYVRNNDDTWTPWSFSDFENLPAGSYTVNVEARDAWNGCLVCAEAGPNLTDYSTCYLNIQAFY